MKRYSGRPMLGITILLLARICLRAQENGKVSLTEMTLEQLININVRAATKTGIRQIEVPQAVSILNRSDIERLPANSLGELLRFVVGANVLRAQTSQNITSLRGSNPFTPSKILILVDGQPIDPTLFSTTWWELVPISIGDIERIEFIRSPGTIYGANAQNGVLNIITQKADATRGNMQELRFSGKYGQQDLEQGYLGLLGTAGDVSYRLSTEFFKVNAYHGDRPMEIVPGRLSAAGEQTFSSNPNQLNLQSFSGAVETKLHRNPLKVSVGFKDVRNAQGRVPDRLCFIGMDGYLGYVNANYSFEAGGAKHSATIGSDLTDYRFKRNSDSDAETLSPAEVSLKKLNFGYEIKKNAGEKHNLLLGTTYVLESVANASGERFLVDQQVNREPIVSLYAQDEWLATGKDHIYYGGLFSNHYVSGSSFSPMLAYVRKLNERNILRLATFTSYRNPNVFEHSMDYDQATGAVAKRTRLVSNRALRAERTTSYELGFRSEPTLNIFWSADFYVDQVRNAIEWTQLGVEGGQIPRPRYRSENTLKQRVVGVEAVLKCRFLKYWNVENNFTFTAISNSSLRPEYQGSGLGASNVGQGRYGSEYVPPYIYEPIVSFDRGRFHASAQYQYSAAHVWQWPAWSAATGRDALLLKPVPGYGLVNLFAGVNLGRGLALALEAYNLSDNRHTEWRGDESYFGRALRVRLDISIKSISASRVGNN